MYIRTNHLAATGAFAALLLAYPVCAQDSSQHMDTGTQKMMSSADTPFAMKAAQGGMAEVKMGQLAVDKASNPDVKAFGQRMIDDHTKAGDKLKSICAAENMTPPTDLNAKDQAEYDRLSKMSGAEFDKAYMKGMVKDHEMDIKDFEKESKSGKDPQLKQFASDTLPTLQSHLQQAKSSDA